MNRKPLDDWHPKDSNVLKNQSQAFDEMRQRCPVAHSEFMGWSLFRHKDVTSVLNDTETFSNVSCFPAIPNGMDPPEHTEYREALNPNFAADYLLQREPDLRDVAENLLGPIIANSETDFVESFSDPFTMKCLCVLLGWPEEQWQCLRGWTHGNQHAALSQNHNVGKALASLFDEHVKTNLERKRSETHKGYDATTALLATQVRGKPLSDDQIVSILRNWTAGHGTVSAGLGILVMHLAEDEYLQNTLRRNPSLIPKAVEEILRSDGPLVANRRTLTKEATIAGRTIMAGEKISLMWIAANRDPEIFEDPEKISLERDTDKSLLWGQGIHVCQGASLARLELRIALEALLEGSSHFEIAAAPERAVFPSNGLTRLPLRIRGGK